MNGEKQKEEKAFNIPNNNRSLSQYMVLSIYTSVSLLVSLSHSVFYSKSLFNMSHSVSLYVPLLVSLCVPLFLSVARSFSI